MYRFWSILLIILAVLCGLLVGTLNSDKVTLDLLWVSLHWPLGLLILLSVATGLLLGMGMSYVFQVLPLKMKARRQRKAVASEGSEAPELSDD